MSCIQIFFFIEPKFNLCCVYTADKDIIRPQGVGVGRNPPLWLKDGDVVKVSLEGVGSCTNTVENVKSAGSTSQANL